MGQNARVCYDSNMEQTAVANTSTEKEKKQYTGAPLRAMKLLAQGVTELEVARALGVAAGLISQYKAEPEFMIQLQEMIAQAFADHKEIDDNYTTIEKRLSERLKDQTALMFHPDQILRVLKFANEAKRKVAPNIQNGTTGEGHGLKTVVLVMPAVMRKEIELNPLNEVVGVNGQELVTLNSKSLDSLVAKRKVVKLPNANKPRESSDPYSDL